MKHSPFVEYLIPPQFYCDSDWLVQMSNLLHSAILLKHDTSQVLHVKQNAFIRLPPLLSMQEKYVRKSCELLFNYSYQVCIFLFPQYISLKICRSVKQLAV